MFRGNILLRSANEKIEYTDDIMKEYIRCKTDIFYFAEKYFKIVTIDEGLQLIKMWDFQKKMLKAFVDPPVYKGQKKRHCVVLASRQIGKSTVSRIFLLHKMLFNQDKTYALLANKEKTAIKLLKEVQDAYMHLPLWLQQGIMDDGWNKTTILLENNVTVIAASTASSSIRSYTISLLFLDEFAFVEEWVADDFIKSVIPTTISGKTSQIIVVSTPNGMNHFYNIWKKAINGDSSYFPIKVRWDQVPGRDQQWKIDTIKDLPKGLLEFNQEYNCFTNNTYINIINKKSGKEERIKIGELYERIINEKNE